MGGLARRLLFKSALVAGFGLAAAPGRAEPARATKIVYHLVDAERAAMALGNLRNHVAGAGGPGAAQFACVILGPALRLFRRSGGDLAAAEDMRQRMAEGVVFYACANTLKAQQWTLDDLQPGFQLAEKGGVTLLADLQAQGYAYIRP
jgi:intracellular sulfur oxidation DsrE/DsrF family protein